MRIQFLSHFWNPLIKYSSVPNRRAGPNKRAGGKILEKKNKRAGQNRRAGGFFF